MPTPAVDALDRAGVDYVLHDYDVDEAVGEGYGEAVADAIGADPEAVFKTLVGVVDGDPVVAIVPVTARLSTKALARAAGGKKARMADPADAERLTGSVVGGVSPFGRRRRLPVYVDGTAPSFPTVFVSAGKRGVQVEIAPDDLLRLTGGVVADLT